MILAVIIEIYILGIIGTLWDEEIVLYEHQKRKYKLIKAFLFLITGIISFFLRKYFWKDHLFIFFPCSNMLCWRMLFCNQC